MKRLEYLGALALAIVAIVAVGTDAAAVVGMPLTPLSVAGVARRTTRRVAYASTVSATPASTVTVLPSGCTEVVQSGIAYQHCRTAYYRPYYQGPNLVYVAAAP
jgi:hypothetical protein